MVAIGRQLNPEFFMMNVSVIARRITGIAAGVALLACGEGSSEPAEPASAESVLELAALQARTAGDAEATAVLDGATLAVRIGVRPTTIAVSVGGEVTRYAALVVAFVDATASGELVTRRRLVAWRGQDRRVALLHVSTIGDGGSFAPDYDRTTTDIRVRPAVGRWFNFVRGTRWVAVDGTAKIAVASIGDNCPLADRRDDVRCVVARFGVGVDGLFRLLRLTTDRATTDDRIPAVRIQTSADAVNGIIIGRNGGG